MEKIVIEVTEESAKWWRSSSKVHKKKISTIIDKLLALEKKQRQLTGSFPALTREEIETHRAAVLSQLPEYKRFLDEVADQVAARGLTDEILLQLLEEDD